MKTYSRSIKSPCPMRELTDNENCCRLCLTKDNIMIHIFNEDEIVPIPLKLKYCIALEVSEDDGLPCGICTDCISKLDESYAFKKRCLATDAKLRQYLQLPYANSNFNANESSSKDMTLSETSRITRNSKDACTIKMEDNGLFFLKEFCSTVNKMNNGNNIMAANIDLSNMDIENGDLNSTFDSDLNNTPININNDYGTHNNDCEKVNTIEELQENLNAMNTVETSQPGIVLPRKRTHSLSHSLNSYASEDEFGNDNEQERTDEDEEHANSVSDDSSSLKKLNKPSYKCTPCNTTFFNYKYLLDHKHANHSETLKMCSFCPKTFLTNSTLERHLRTHTGERPYHCEHCGKRFSQKDILNRHALVHLEEKSRTAKCGECNYMCGSEDLLHRHVRIRHSDSNERLQIPKFQCSKCDKAFYHPSGLSRHQAVHAGILYKCTACVKSFSDKSSVKRHFVKVHSHQKNSNDKYYQICNFRY